MKAHRYITTLLAGVCLLMVSCKNADRYDRADESLNRQIVRLTQDNVDLRQRVKAAEDAQVRLRADLQQLQNKLAYLEAQTGTGRSPATLVNATAPTSVASTKPVQTPRRGGFTDWGQSTSAPPPGPTTTSPNNVSRRVTSDATIIAYCSAKWGSNFEMVEYCEKEQQGAKDRLDRGNVYGISGPVFSAIRQQCQQKWATNFEMREYCEKEQAGAYKRLNP